MINDLKNFLIILKKEHIFLFISLFFSFFITVISLLLYFLIIVNKNFLLLIFIIPLPILILTTYIAIHLYKRHPILTNIITLLFNTFMIVIIQIFIGLLVLFSLQILDEEILFKDPAYYERALNSISHQGRVQHFPKSIPADAVNVELNASFCFWFGSEAIALKFNISPEYIENQLKKQNFVSIESPGNYTHEFKDAMVDDNGRIDLDGLTFYVINDKKHESGLSKGFPYHYGIGVNKSNNTILYYYTCPD